MAAISLWHTMSKTLRVDRTAAENSAKQDSFLDFPQKILKKRKQYVIFITAF